MAGPLSIRIPDAMLEQLDKEAAAAFRSRAQQVLWYIAQGLKREVGAPAVVAVAPVVGPRLVSDMTAFHAVYGALEKAIERAELGSATEEAIRSIEALLEEAGEREREVTDPSAMVLMDRAHVRAVALRNGLKRARE